MTALNELLSDVTDENNHSEQDWGNPEGHEEW